MSVFRIVLRAFDRQRHEISFALVQPFGGQIDGLRARPVAQLQRDRPGRVHISQILRRGPSRRRILSDPNVRQKTAAVVVLVQWFGHLMMIQLELGD